jgi:phage/plasmid-like protein (TIGR03299 family)
MAHELDFTKGFPAIAYRGDVPWHGFGHQMTGDETIDDWKVKAGMDYDVVTRKAYFYNTDGTQVAIPDVKALVRDDTDQTLAMVSRRYKVVQPATVIEFFRSLCERQGFEMETAGVLANGKRVWALARLGKDFVLPPNDKIEGFLLLATSYDAKFATTAQLTSVRVVCNNTLTWSLEGDQHAVIRVPHSQDFNPNSVKADLGLLDEGWAGFTGQIKQLAETPVSERQAVEYFMVISGNEDEDMQFALDNSYILKKLWQAYQYAPGQNIASAKGTAWGLVNAVTYFTDHTRKASNNGTRMNNAWFGASAAMKRKAFDLALQLSTDIQTNQENRALEAQGRTTRLLEDLGVVA